MVPVCLNNVYSHIVDAAPHCLSQINPVPRANIYHVMCIYIYIVIVISTPYPYYIPIVVHYIRHAYQVNPGPSGPSALSAPAAAKSPLLLPCYLATGAMGIK